MNYLRVNGDKLLWTNDLESLKNFLENVLKQQGRWLTPGGNTKHFKSSNGNVINNWYNRKQQTLSFHGPDGPSLRDKLVDLVQKKPGTTTDLHDPNPSVSTKQTTHLSLREADGSEERNSRISINDVGSTNCSKERSNPDIVANIGGLKLDFMILPKQIEENSRLLSTINAQTQDENAFAELLNCKKTRETQLSSVSKKDNAVRELEEKCLTSESRVLSLEQENGSLRLF